MTLSLDESSQYTNDMELKNDYKQKAAYITAILAFILGWALVIAGFCVPPVGEVSGSVLAVLGQAMVYAASVFGVTMYFSSEMYKFKAETREFLKNEKNGNEE